MGRTLATSASPDGGFFWPFDPSSETSVASSFKKTSDAGNLDSERDCVRTSNRNIAVTSAAGDRLMEMAFAKIRLERVFWTVISLPWLRCVRINRSTCAREYPVTVMRYCRTKPFSSRDRYSYPKRSNVAWIHALRSSLVAKSTAGFSPFARKVRIVSMPGPCGSGSCDGDGGGSLRLMWMFV